MRIQHLLRILVLLFFGGFPSRFALKQFTMWAGRSIGVDAENLIETKTGQKLSTTLSAMDHVKMPMPSDGAIHCARIYVVKTDLSCELKGNAAFTGRSRAINRNDTMNGRDIHREKSWCGGKLGAPFTFFMQALSLRTLIPREVSQA